MEEPYGKALTINMVLRPRKSRVPFAGAANLMINGTGSVFD
jgi:hypothetical protein